jgi:bisphosphoglycerate-dependent phosphoglycerate mutase
MKYTLVLVRHGESTWNEENRFTGWADVPLSKKGLEEAKQGAKLLKESGLSFDVAYTSTLSRAIKTLWIILEEMNLMYSKYFDFVLRFDSSLCIDEKISCLLTNINTTFFGVACTCTFLKSQ